MNAALCQPVELSLLHEHTLNSCFACPTYACLHRAHAAGPVQRLHQDGLCSIPLCVPLVSPLSVLQHASPLILELLVFTYAPGVCMVQKMELVTVRQGFKRYIAGVS